MTDYVFGKNRPPHRRWPIAWYNPPVLWRSLREMASTGDQIRNLDRREMYPQGLELIPLDQAPQGEDFWWDFVSDTGDGGNATYTVAREMQKPLLQSRFGDGVMGADVPAHMPMGELLVLGGDLAYPGASVEEYQYRLTEMWTAAAPQARPPREEAASLRPSLAIPQNHDWFDNISTFNRYFVDAREPRGDMALASAETQLDVTPLATRKLQRQSYFAARLPHNWVLLGFDFALVGDIDRQQYAAFEQLFRSQQISAQDNLILLYPEPYWTRDLGDHARPGYPKRYQRFEAFLRDGGYSVRLRIAGDVHHYAREWAAADGDQPQDLLVIAGGGGAFLHPTHSRIASQDKVLSSLDEDQAMTPDLAQRLRLGIDDQQAVTAERVYNLRQLYPSPAQSRALLKQSWRALFRPAGRGGKGHRLQAWLQGNVMYSVLVGGLFAAATLPTGWIPGLLLALLFAGISNERSRWLPRLGFGLGSGLALLAEALSHYGAAWFGGIGTYLWLALIAFPLGFVLGGLLTGIYFAICSHLGLLPNNGFSHLGYQGYKSFVRFRIDAQGHLHGYVWGADDVPRQWVKNPQGDFPLWVAAPGEPEAQWEIKDVFKLAPKG